MKYQLSIFLNRKTINLLIYDGIIPSYGFPVDLIQMNYLKKDSKNNKTSLETLERNIDYAIREFAPKTEIMINHKVYSPTSISSDMQYGDSEMIMYEKIFYYVCPCGTYREDNGTDTECPICHRKVRPFGQEKNNSNENDTEHKYYVRPASFTVIEKPRDAIEKRSLINSKNTLDFYLEFERNIKPGNEFAWTVSHDVPLRCINSGKNKKGFRLCKTCGYLEPEPAKEDNFKNNKHQYLQKNGYDTYNICKCKSSNPEENVYLGTRDNTDVLILAIPNVNENSKRKIIMQTLLTALRLTCAAFLRIDPRELGEAIFEQESLVAIYEKGSSSRSGIIDFLNLNHDEIITDTIKRLEPTETHNCKRYCRKCLLSYDTAYLIQKNLINRSIAWKWYEETQPLSNSPRTVSPEEILARIQNSANISLSIRYFSETLLNNNCVENLHELSLIHHILSKWSDKNLKLFIPKSFNKPDNYNVLNLLYNLQRNNYKVKIFFVKDSESCFKSKIYLDGNSYDYNNISDFNDMTLFRSPDAKWSEPKKYSPCQLSEDDPLQEPEQPSQVIEIKKKNNNSVFTEYCLKDKVKTRVKEIIHSDIYFHGKQYQDHYNNLYNTLSGLEFCDEVVIKIFFSIKVMEESVGPQWQDIKKAVTELHQKLSLIHKSSSFQITVMGSHAQLEHKRFCLLKGESDKAGFEISVDKGFDNGGTMQVLLKFDQNQFNQLNKTPYSPKYTFSKTDEK